MSLTYKELAAAVAKKVENPAEWLWTLRRLVEMAGADVTRFVPINSNTLDMACYSLLDGLGKHRPLHDKFQQVITDWASD